MHVILACTKKILIEHVEADLLSIFLQLDLERVFIDKIYADLK